MQNRVKVIKLVIIAAALIGSILIGAVVINSPYYPGFESKLSYLSPDLSENRTVIRDSVYLAKVSDIKIVFERKDFSIGYDRFQFYDFVYNLEIQIWNESEYFELDYRELSFFNSYPDSLQIPIGKLKGKGKYFIYISSDYGVNASYNIGIGIGQESKFPLLGNNQRQFY